MILFLDFDGVVHPVKSDISKIFCHMEMLADFLVHRAPDWSIVLSTSWREAHPMDELLDFIPESIHHRVIGTTVYDSHPGPRKMDPMLAERSLRQAQGLYYMQSRPAGEPWLFVDDDATLFDPGLEQLVLCDPRKGLTVETLDHLLVQYNLCYNSCTFQGSFEP